MFQFRRAVYCDNNATTPVSPKVQKTMAGVLRDCYANPSSPYKMAHRAAGLLAQARSCLAQATGAMPEELIFTSCATEANNTLLSTARMQPPHKRGIVFNPAEHPAMLEPLKLLQAEGFSLRPLQLDAQGRIVPGALEACWDESIFLISCMYVNNETGTIHDIARMAHFARERGALFFCDCVQALGKIPVDLHALGVDYASFSAHKIYGPKGIGALYVRRGAPFAPYLLGGHQEEGARAGTESLHNIAGFGVAAEAVPGLLLQTEALRAKKNAFIREVRAIAPSCQINSPQGVDCQAGTVSITFPGKANAVLMGQLDYYGISVAAGSACNTGEDLPSHVLLAMGLSPEQARSTLRFSFGHQLKDKDLAYVVRVLRDILSGKGMTITAVSPAQLTEHVLFAPDIFIIDLRRTHKSKYTLKALPGSVEFPFYSIGKHLDKIPRKRPVFVTCEVGADAPMIAYYLRRKGYTNLSFLAFGLLGWKLAQPDLYAKYAGQEAISKAPHTAV